MNFKEIFNIKSWTSNYKILIIIATLLILSLHFTQMGINPDSTTYSVISRNMLETGRWISPTYTEFYYSDFAQHPPLVMWINAVIFKLFGASDVTARIFGSFCILGSVFILLILGQYILNRKFGFLAGLILLLTPNFISFGNSTLLDGPMTLFILLAILGWVISAKNPERTFPFLVVGAGLGLAFMSKGLAALPAYLGVMIAGIWNKNSRKNHRFYLGILLSLLIPAAYMLIEKFIGRGQFMEAYFLRQIGGAAAGTIKKGNARYFKYPVKFLTEYFLPWSILFLYGSYLMFRDKIKLLYLPFIIQIIYFVFYSFAPRVYAHYYMPSYALGSIVAALPAWMLIKKKNYDLKKFNSFFLGTLILISALIQFIPIRFQYIRRPHLMTLSPHIKEWIEKTNNNNGLSVGEVNWGLVAKAKWYWNADILFTEDIASAMKKLKGKDFSFIVCKKDKIKDLNFKNDIEILAENTKFTILASRQDIEEYGGTIGEFPVEWIR